MGSVTPSAAPGASDNKPKRRIAVVGAGPSGAITVDALVREACFDVIRVFERREGPGGCWLDDTNLGTAKNGVGSQDVPSAGGPSAQPVPHPDLGPDVLAALAARRADAPVEVPSEDLLLGGTNSSTATGLSPELQAEAARLRAQRGTLPRFAESSIYPYLETNVDVVTMQYSQEPIVASPSARSVAMHGPDTPFRHWTAMRQYVEGLVRRKGYEELIEYNTTVERAEKVGEEWKLTLRKEVVVGEAEGVKKKMEDVWWVEWFDGLVVASGHFSVPYIPHVEGLEDLVRDRPGSVLHSKQFRGRDAFKDKRVVVVGASVSAADIAFDLVGAAKSPVHAVMADRNANPFFGDGAFHHPGIARHPTILRIEVEPPTTTTTDAGSRHRRVVHFIDGSSASDVDHIIFGTGYTWSLPFLPSIPTRNNRVPDLYQHVVYTRDPSLLFVGGVGAGLTFKIFEWQAVLAARVLAGRAKLPAREEQERWEAERIAARGDGKGFLTIAPDFEEYFETLRAMAGPGEGESGETDLRSSSPSTSSSSWIQGAAGVEGKKTATSAGVGRPLPPFDPAWQDAFMAGHERRKDMWRRRIEEDAKTWPGQSS
ncbi:hypothetical protein Micbo1qcDRAFT_232013 [Microdochium bolleyi]|uniref:Dimethylaniline monooxygenase n=1 Tax=Microdochium bolleyi TaxID=196109 RepID=A0A136JBN4_9PEZI|nr:hypothetical protein Micbo1qcDRAFT_232013 [Microdochium bolleyi]